MHMQSSRATADKIVHHPAASKWEVSPHSFKLSCTATGEGLEHRKQKGSLQHYLLPVTGRVNG